MRRSTIGLLVLASAMVVTAQEFTSTSARLAGKNYKRDLAQADKAYATALQSALRQAQFNKDEAEAERIKDALKPLVGDRPQGANVPTRFEPRPSFKTVRVPGNKRPGYVVGKISKGDRLIVQYVSGMFANWNTTLLSPDVTDTVRCDVAAKMGDDYVTLEKIPTGTKDQPFEYTFGDAFESVALMNPGNPWETKGEAVYKVAIVRAQ